jgi:hypothetical protein
VVEGLILRYPVKSADHAFQHREIEGWTYR